MSTNKWTRNEKIGLAAVVLALAACVVAILIPEIRKFIGLESSSVSSSITEAVASELTNANKNQGQNPNANRHDDAKQTNNNSPVNMNSSTLPITKPEPPNDTSKQQPTEERPIATKEAEGFSFELRSCRTSGSNIVVSLMITNHGADKALWLFDDTSITDYNGEVHNVDDKRFGGSAPEATFRTDITIKATLTFNGIAQTVKRVRLLDLHFQEFHVLFRDFAVSN